MDPVLVDRLREAQRVGLFGPGPIEDAIEHAHGFVDALAPVAVGDRIVDLGSGGGLPGLVLAATFPSALVVLVDRRQKRTDFLTRVVTGLGWDHVEVRCEDVAAMRRRVRDGLEDRYDAVTARGFGPPSATIRAAADLVAIGGRIVISEPPVGDRWPSTLLDELGLIAERVGRVRRFTFR